VPYSLDESEVPSIMRIQSERSPWYFLVLNFLSEICSCLLEIATFSSNFFNPRWFCVFYLPRASLFILWFVCIISCLFWVINISASDCLERLISKMTYYVSSGSGT